MPEEEGSELPGGLVRYKYSSELEMAQVPAETVPNGFVAVSVLPYDLNKITVATRPLVALFSSSLSSSSSAAS